MVANIVIANLLRIARQDLDAAQRLATPYNRNAVYLCEQSAEKIIRAVLTSENIHAGIRHQLADMVDQVPDANPIKPLLRDIQELSAYATAYRYTTPAGKIPTPPTETQFIAFAQKTELALAFAVTRFGVTLTAKDVPAQSPGPIR